MTPFRIFVTLLVFLAAGWARADERRFAVLIGANLGDPTEGRLRYAEADAERLGQTLRALGDFSADRVLLLTGVGADEVRQALIHLNARIRADGDAALLFVYYSGHADADRLHLAGTHLPTDELRALVVGSPAASRVLVIDACRSGALTRVKGGKPAPAFQVISELAPPPTGVALLTSSADGEDSQESDQLRASFFTYYFNSGLIGGADLNRDGRVTLAEAFSFAAEQTLSATMGTLAGPQHPTYRFELGGRQDLVLTRPRPTTNRLGALQISEPGRYAIARLEGRGGSVAVAELEARAGGAQVALPPGRYQITLRGRDHLYEGDVEVQDGQVAQVSAARMDRLAYARMVRKGVGSRAHSVSAAGGVQSSLGGFGPGWVAGLAFRQDRRLFFWEARAVHGRSGVDRMPVSFDISNQLFTAGLVVGKSWDLGLASLTVGLEGAALAIRQRYLGQPFLLDWRRPETRTIPSTLTWGALVGPVVQLDLPLRYGGFVRLEGAVPTHVLPSSYTTDPPGITTLSTARLLAGAGIYF